MRRQSRVFPEQYGLNCTGRLNNFFKKESVIRLIYGEKGETRGSRPIVDQLYDDVPTLKSTSVCLNSLRVVSPGDRR